MKNLAPTVLVIVAVLAGALLGAKAQQAPGGAAAAPFDTYAVDSLRFADEYKIGREIDTVFAITVCGEPFREKHPEFQPIGLAQLLSARGKQGYTLVQWFEGPSYEFPQDAHYSTASAKSNVRLVWGKKA